MDDERKLALTTRYGDAVGCLSEAGLLQAIYSEMEGIDEDLDETDILWMYKNQDYCSEQTYLKRVRVLEIVSGDLVRVMSCNTTACQASMPNGYVVHLYGLSIPESGKANLASLLDQIVDMRTIETNQTLGVPDVVIYADGININDTLQGTSVVASDEASVVFTEVYSVNPKQMQSGDNVWINAQFKNMGSGQGEYAYYIGARLEDRDGTVWDYEGNDQYAARIPAGETKEMRANFTVPTYMDAPIAWKILLYKKLA